MNQRFSAGAKFRAALQAESVLVGDITREMAKTVHVNLQEPLISTSDVIASLSAKYAFYVLLVRYDESSGWQSGRNREVHSTWRELVPDDHIALLDNPEDLMDSIRGIYAKETDRVDYFRKEIESRQPADRVASTYRALTGIHRGAMEAGAPSIGLNIQLPKEQSLNAYTTQSQGFHYFFTRKVMLSFAAQAYVFFPGGFGTLNELTELMMLVQTKKIDPLPIVLVGKDFWRPFMKWIEEHVYENHKAIDKEDMQLYHLAQDVEEAFQIIKNIDACPPNAMKCWYGYQPHHLRGGKGR